MAKPKLKKFSVTFDVEASLSVDVMALDMETALAIGRATRAADVLGEYDELIDAQAEVTGIWVVSD